jgi:hypothetical protein
LVSRVSCKPLLTDPVSRPPHAWWLESTAGQSIGDGTHLLTERVAFGSSVAKRLAGCWRCCHSGARQQPANHLATELPDATRSVSRWVPSPIDWPAVDSSRQACGGLLTGSVSKGLQETLETKFHAHF